MSTVPTTDTGLAVPRTLSSSTTQSDLDKSPNRTLTDLHADHGHKLPLPAESTLGKVQHERINKEEVESHGIASADALSSLPAGRKMILLLCFCLA